VTETMAPKTPLQRSALYRRAGGAVTALADCLVPSGPVVRKEDQRGRLVLELRDDSARARMGIKGAGATAWLSATSIDVPAAPNRALPSGDDLLAGRLGAEEYLLLATSEAGNAVVRGLAARFDDRMSGSVATVAFVPRYSSHVPFRLAGDRVGDVLARLCTVDCSTEGFPEGAILQTMLAGCAAILMRRQREIIILCERTTAEHLLACIEAAASELE